MKTLLIVIGAVIAVGSLLWGLSEGFKAAPNEKASDNTLRAFAAGVVVIVFAVVFF